MPNILINMSNFVGKYLINNLIPLDVWIDKISLAGFIYIMLVSLTIILFIFHFRKGIM